MKLVSFIQCTIKFLLICLQFICNINQQWVDNKIKVFHSKKFNRLCSNLQKINQNLGIVGYGLIFIFDISWISKIFSIITISWFLTLSTINSIFFSLTSSSNFWKVLSLCFNSTTCCKSWSFSTASKFSLEISYFLSFLKPFIFMHTGLDVIILVLWLAFHVLKVFHIILMYKFIICTCIIEYIIIIMRKP